MALPSVTAVTPSSPQTGTVRIDYTVVDADSDTCAMTFRYSSDGGFTYFACTEAPDPLSEGTVGLSSSPGGDDHVFIWDAPADLPLIAADVRIEVVADDTPADGPSTPFVTGSFAFANAAALSGGPVVWPGIFALNNTPPVGAFIFPNPQGSPPAVAAAVQGGTVLLEYNVEDEDTDLCSVEFEFTRNGGRTWEACVPGTGGDGSTGLTSDTAVAGGIDHEFAWDTSSIRSARVELRGRLHDGFVFSDYFYSEFLWIENQDALWWTPTQIAPIIYRHDPDDVIRYFADLLEAWRVREAGEILAFEDLFDPQKCPEEWLPHLAERIGLRIDQDFPEAVRRRQIRLALDWYRSKGLEESIRTRFLSLGYEAFVDELWTDGFGGATEQLGPDWMPHARIDLRLLQFDVHSPVSPTDFDELTRYIEEVRPIHVLVREVITGIVAIDRFGVPTDDDGTADISVSPVMTIEGTFSPSVHYVPNDHIDETEWIAAAGPGLALFNGTRSRVTASAATGLTLAGERDPFTDETFDLHVRPEIGPPFRDIITLADMATAGVTLADGSGWYQLDEGTITAFDTLGAVLPGYPKAI